MKIELKWPEDYINTVIQGDCLEVMKQLPDKCIDLVLTDPPYGMTSNEWDDEIVLESWWKEIRRITRDERAVVVFGSQPFTTKLIASNLKDFRYCWIWNKKKSANAMLAEIQPLKIHEDICVFSKVKHLYNPLMRQGEARIDNKNYVPNGDNFGKDVVKRQYVNPEGLYYPKSILEFSNADQTNKNHPTEKPVALTSYLIQTYSNPNDLVLDCFLGAGGVAVAAKQLGRNFIGIEISEKYCKIARDRLRQDILL